jgi:hypothetical protein
VSTPIRHHQPQTDGAGFRIPSSGEGGYEHDPRQAWGMDAGRHDVDGFDSQREPCSVWVQAWETGQGGRFAWKIRCGCGTVFSGRTEEAVKATLREHAGSR